MPIRKFRPTSPGRRGATGFTFQELTKKAPEKNLTVSKSRTDGRSGGKISIRHRGGGAKRLIRIIDFKREKLGVPGKITALEYDPGRSARIALVVYADGDKRYMLAPDGMKVGDGVLFYHSSTDPMAVAGIAEVSSAPHADPTQFDAASEFHDPKSKKDAPTWMMVDIRFVEEFKHPVTLAELKKTKGLEKMVLTQRGSRLSVQPVRPEEWQIIVALGRKG